MNMNEQTVREYLLQHPEFIERHPDVVAEGCRIVTAFRNA